MSGTWTWISRRREEEILRLETRHLEHILEVAESAVKLIEALSTGDPRRVEEAYQAVKEAERKADQAKDEIIADLSKGIFHPIDREELLRLVLVSDDIADHLNAGTRRLVVLAKVEEEPPPEEIREALREITLIARDSVKLIMEAITLLRRDPGRAVEIARQVERLEEKADEIRSAAEEKVVAWCNERGRPGSCTTLYKALQSLETSTDKCEDTADVIRSIAILST